MIRKQLGSFIAALLLLAIVLMLPGCKNVNSDSNVASPNDAQKQLTPVGSPLTGFAKDLQYIRNGQYTYVWVFSRKDGKPLDKEDAAFLRKNAPQVVDWVTTDEGKKVIGGTNFNLEEGNLSLLKKRFVVEDFSQK
jgi:hypothetical protein